MKKVVCTKATKILTTGNHQNGICQTLFSAGRGFTLVDALVILQGFDIENVKYLTRILGPSDIQGFTNVHGKSIDSNSF